MSHPEISTKRRTLYAKAVCAIFLLANVCHPATLTRQEQQPGAILAPKPVSVEPSKDVKSAPASKRPKPGAEAGGQDVNRKSPTGDAPSSSVQNPSAPLNCNSTYMVQSVFKWGVTLVGHGQPNTMYTVTVSAADPSIIGFSLTNGPPFNSTVDVSFTTNSSGDGVGVYWGKALKAGHTTVLLHLVGGSNGSFDFTAIPQCHCPEIPVIP